MFPNCREENLFIILVIPFDTSLQTERSQEEYCLFVVRQFRGFNKLCLAPSIVSSQIVYSITITEVKPHAGTDFPIHIHFIAPNRVLEPHKKSSVVGWSDLHISNEERVTGISLRGASLENSVACYLPQLLSLEFSIGVGVKDNRAPPQ